MTVRSLPPKRTLNGRFDAYCHVCWQAVHVLWIDDEDPAGRCPFGHTKMTDCGQAMEWERSMGEVAKMRRDGLL